MSNHKKQNNMPLKTATITVDFEDANGNPVQTVETVDYDPTVTEVICEMEHALPVGDGGPVMRPKNPRY